MASELPDLSWQPLYRLGDIPAEDRLDRYGIPTGRQQRIQEPRPAPVRRDRHPQDDQDHG